MANSFTNINEDYAGLNNMTSFNGFNNNIYKDTFISGYSFIFITKPLLFIDPIKPSSNDYLKKMAYSNMTRDPIFVPYLNNEIQNNLDKNIAKMLSYNTNYFSSSFLPIFTNECKSFDPTDSVLSSTEAFSSKQGFRQILPTFSTESEGAGSFSIDVNETANLDFTKLLTLWVKYISNISDGTFDANPNMVNDGVLDFVSSLFYFVLEPDGQTIKYWAKYTGCWPSTIPSSPLRYQKGNKDQVELSIPFNYMMKEEMSPSILEDFNKISLKVTYKNLNSLINSDFYRSYNNSPLLNLETMKESIPEAYTNIMLSDDKRDPIILYKGSQNKNTINTDSTNSSFKLIFDRNGYTNSYLKDILQDNGENYFINYENYLNKK